MIDWRIEIRISVTVVIDYVESDSDTQKLYSRLQFRLKSIYERHSVYDNIIMYLNEPIGEKNDRIESGTHGWGLPYFTNEKDEKNKNRFYLIYERFENNIMHKCENL